MIVWMEMVRLRAPQSQENWLPALLVESLKNITGEPGLVEARVYTSASFQSDLSVMLVWKTDAPQLDGSREGLTISQIFKTYGLVEHSVWIEKDLMTEKGQPRKRQKR